MHVFSGAFAHVAEVLSPERFDDGDRLDKLAELLRCQLSLDNQQVVAAAVFFQFLINEMKTKGLRFLLVAAHNFGIKLTCEGFYTVDILERVTREFAMKDLRETEAFILSQYSFKQCERSQTAFRNALVAVALGRARDCSSQLMGRCNSPDGHNWRHMHILLMDKSTRSIVESNDIIRAIVPEAKVFCFRRSRDAIDFLEECRLRQFRIDLALVEQSAGRSESGDLPVARKLLHNEACTNPIFSPRPLVALLTEHAIDEALLRPDGGYRGCDTALTKPLTLAHFNVLAQAACP